MFLLSDSMLPAKRQDLLLLSIRSKNETLSYLFYYWQQNIILLHYPVFSNVLFFASRCFPFQKFIDVGETFLHMQLLDSQCEIAVKGIFNPMNLYPVARFQKGTPIYMDQEI